MTTKKITYKILIIKSIFPDSKKLKIIIPKVEPNIPPISKNFQFHNLYFSFFREQ